LTTVSLFFFLFLSHDLSLHSNPILRHNEIYCNPPFVGFNGQLPSLPDMMMTTLMKRLFDDDTNTTHSVSCSNNSYNKTHRTIEDGSRSVKPSSSSIRDRTASGSSSSHSSKSTLKTSLYNNHNNSNNKKQGMCPAQTRETIEAKFF